MKKYKELKLDKNGANALYSQWNSGMDKSKQKKSQKGKKNAK